MGGEGEILINDNDIIRATAKKPGKLLDFSNDLGQSSKFILPGFEIIQKKLKGMKNLSCEVNWLY